MRSKQICLFNATFDYEAGTNDVLSGPAAMKDLIKHIQFLLWTGDCEKYYDPNSNN